MAAKIRLKKVGRRGQPSYRVVVLDGRKPRDAKVVADLGHYDPKTNPATFEIDGDAALKWLLDGAKATRAARDILSKAGVMAAWDAAKRGETIEIEKKELKPTAKKKKEAAPAEEPEEAEAPAAETPEDAEPAAESEAASEEVAEAEDAPEPEAEPEAEEPKAEQEASEDEPEEAPEEEAEADAEEDEGEDEEKA
jgi:small subunit ribosomal protein S16